ncbi:hypothetical protein BN439_1425 [Erwinia amylovora Ea644]|nr:hypothetical protein BN439_1425 [Erwinia amylovora Ea644]
MNDVEFWLVTRFPD